MKVQLWDYDLTSFDDSLGGAITDDAGYFSIGPIPNTEPLQGKQDIYLKLVADNEAAVVKQSHNGATYVVQTPRRDEFPSGVYDTTIVLSNSESGAFFVADAVLIARDKWLQWRSDKNPGQVEVELATLDQSTQYTPQDYIHIESGDYPDIGAPDTFDRDIILHEYGHRLQDVFDFLDTGGGSHAWCDQRTWELGASEGFCNWLACYMTNKSRLYDSHSNFADTDWYDLENGQVGDDFGFTDCGSANNNGLSCEGAVAGIFWDVTDQSNDDYSTIGIFPFPWNGYNPDGVGDSIGNLNPSVLACLVDRNYSGHHPDRMFDFWAAWHNSPTLGHTKGLRDVYVEHGDDIFVSCCYGVRGDVNMSGVVDLSDLSALQSYITGGGYVLPCPSEANVNGVGIVDISDVAALISYLYSGGYVLPPCGP